MNGHKAKQKLMAGLALLVVAGSAMAQATVPAPISSGIEDAIALIVLVVGLGGAGYIVISSASVAWNVGAKFIKRLAGKA